MNVFIAAGMRTGSTHITNVLGRLLRLRRGELHMFQREGRYNEDQMINSDLAGMLLPMGGWIFQMHIRNIGSNGQILEEHGIRPIVTVRNIYDCIISWCDSQDRNVKAGKGNNHTMSPICIPNEWSEWDVLDKWMWAARNVVPWYCSFHYSWQQYPSTLWVKNEKFFKDQASAVLRILAWVGYQGIAEQEWLKSAVEQRDGKFHKGISGEGKRRMPLAIQEVVRKHVVSWKNRKMMEDYL